jgi:hypothetical protein
VLTESVGALARSALSYVSEDRSQYNFQLIARTKSTITTSTLIASPKAIESGHLIRDGVITGNLVPAINRSRFFPCSRKQGETLADDREALAPAGMLNASHRTLCLNPHTPRASQQRRKEDFKLNCRSHGWASQSENESARQTDVASDSFSKQATSLCAFPSEHCVGCESIANSVSEFHSDRPLV